VRRLAYGATLAATLLAATAPGAHANTTAQGGGSDTAAAAERQGADATTSLPQTAIVDGNVVVYFWPGGEAFAREVATAAASALRLPALPAGVLEFPPPIRIFLPPDEQRFDSITGGRAPEWGAGVALVDSSIIVLPGFSSRTRGALQDLGPVLRHELAHIALHRYLGPIQIPRWFSEGYATWSAGQLDGDAAWLLRLAFLTQRAPPLDSLALDWPVLTTDARVAYLLSASAVGFLAETGGERGLEMLLSRWRETGNFEDALRSTYTMTIGQLEEYWGRSVRRRYGWLLFFAQTAVIWVVISIFVLILFVIRRRRDRARMERLKAAEIPDDPAFWLEPPADGMASGPADGTASAPADGHDSGTGQHDPHPRIGPPG
jgi:hypothetical protein